MTEALQQARGTHRASMSLKVLAALFVFLTPAYSYTDPGSGVLIYQMITAACVGGLFYVRRLFTFFSSKRRKKE